MLLSSYVRAKMLSVIARIGLGICSVALIGCATSRLDPAGEATTKHPIADLQIASLRAPISLAELKRICGPAEGQPRPRVTYRSADHAGQFFWVYYFRPQEIPNPGEDDTMVHHIVRADRFEEGAVVVWPAQWTRRPVWDASSELSKLYDQSMARREQNAAPNGLGLRSLP